MTRGGAFGASRSDGFDWSRYGFATGRGAQHRVCVRSRAQGYGGGMVGAASARTGSGSLFFFGRPPDDLPWTLRFFGGISCGREGIAGVRRAITAAVRPVAAGERRAGEQETFCCR